MIGLKNDPRTRYPIWQPEENYHRSLGRRLTVHENNRYPTDLEHSANEDLVDETTWMWRKFIEEEGDI